LIVAAASLRNALFITDSQVPPATFHGLVYSDPAFQVTTPTKGEAMSEDPQVSPQAVSKDEQNWAMICHLSALAGFIIPFGNLIGPLVVWQMKKDTMPLVDQHGKEALNFQITVTIAALICVVLMLVLIGVFLIMIVGLGALVFTIIAGIKVANGELDYKYPFALRLIK
jgi:uncharacterized Tic20 family protein